MYSVGSCVLLRESAIPHFTYHSLPIDDIHLWDSEFANKYGQPINSWLKENDINLPPYFILKSIKKDKYRVVGPNGRERTIKEEDILMEGEPSFGKQTFHSWNLLSVAEEGSSQSCPISPHPQDFKPRATHIAGCWYGLAFEEEGVYPASTRTENPKKEMKLLSPTLKWDDIPHKKLIVGLPWCDAWKPRINEGRTGIGYHITIPTNDVKYSGSTYRNRRANEMTTYQENDNSHFYVPINRLQPSFAFPNRSCSKKWFAINWCPNGFSHIITANA